MRARLLPLTVVALAGWLSAGCITSDTLLKVKPNGSGTMELTFLVNTELFKELGQMMGGEGTSTSKSKSSMPTPEEMAKQLSQMKGVRLVSQTPVKRDGAEGARIVLAFDDINQITVSEDLPGKEFKPAAEDAVKFTLRKLPSGNALLSVQFPDKPGEAAAKPSQNQPRQNQPKDRSAEKMDPAMMKMVAGFFKGMRVTIAVDVEGTLVKTSSPYVEGNRVTLLDVDFGQLMEDPAALEKMDTLPLGPDTSITEARAALEKAGVKGIKINEPTLTIEFR